MRNTNLLYKCILLLLIGWLINTQHVLLAQQNGSWIVSKVLTAKAGLAQNTVNALYVDQQTGFLWIGTEGGLTVYNGITTKNYDTRNAPVFRIARITGFSRTYDNEVVAIDKTAMGICIKGDSLALQQHADYTPYLSVNFYASCLPGIKDSAIYRQHVDSLCKKAGERLQSFTFISDTTVLAFSGTTAYFIGKTALKLNTRFPGHLVLNSLRYSPTQDIIITKDLQAYLMDGDKRTATALTIENPEILKGVPTVYAGVNYTLTVLKDNIVYRLKLKNSTLSFEPFAVLPEVPATVTSINFHPDNNRIFIGSQEEGVFIYARSPFYTYQFSDVGKYTGNSKPKLFSTINNLYASVLIDTNRLHVFYNAGQGGGIVVNLDNGRFNFSPIDTAYPFRMTIDNQKNIYFEQGVLRRLSFTGDNAKEYAYPDITPLAFYYDNKYDKVWTIDGNKRMLLQLNGDSYSEYLRYTANDSADFMMAIKRVNDVLIAYNSSSIFRIDEEHRKLIKVYSFKEPLLRDVYIDEDRYVWISTYGKGIYMYDPALKKLYHPPIDPAGNLAFCHSFVEDGNGNFFIPTNNGLYHINRKNLLSTCKDSTQTLFYHYYDISNGLLTNEFNGGCYPSFTKLPNGDILIPSMQGMVRIFTSSLTKRQAYPLYIQKVSSPRNNYVYHNNMTFQSNERTLTWEVNFAQWEYAPASGLSYRLDNDATWISLNSGERKIILSELKGGRHILRIRNQFDLEGKKIAELAVDFYINKKYFEQPWFWILAALTLLLVIYFVAHLRNRQLRRANIALERKVQSKTIEIKNKNSNLEKTLADLNKVMNQLEQNSNFQKKLIGLLGHDIASPLKSISKVSEQLITYRQKLKEETVTNAILEIGNTSAQLLFLSESIIQWIKVQESEFSPRYSCFDVHGLVEEIAILHNPLAMEKKNCIVNKVPDVLLCVQDPTILKIILHNLLLNANKFTKNGTLTVNASMHDAKLELTVTDNGVGMNADLADKLNHMKTGFSEKGTHNEQGWGLGYSLIIAMLKIVNGKFTINSVKGEGTEVIIILPVNEAKFN